MGRDHAAAIIELAGMTRHCDFYEQVSAAKDENRIRPDVLVRLPGERSIIIDSKPPMNSYWAAQDCRKRRDADRIPQSALKSRSRPYAESQQKELLGSVRIVARIRHSFYPDRGAAFLRARTQSRTGRRSDREERDDRNTSEPAGDAEGHRSRLEAGQHRKGSKTHRRIGRELYDRINTLAGHTFELGRSINRSADHYNKMIGTMERQILSTARKLKDMDVIGDGARQLTDLDPLEIDTRKFQAKEFILGEIRISSNELAESGE